MATSVTINGGTVTMTGTSSKDNFVIDAPTVGQTIYTVSGPVIGTQTGQNGAWSPNGGSRLTLSGAGTWTMTATIVGVLTNSAVFNSSSNQVAFGILSTLTPSGGGE